jgi:hypothetical protein
MHRKVKHVNAKSNEYVVVHRNYAKKHHYSPPRAPDTDSGLGFFIAIGIIILLIIIYNFFALIITFFAIVTGCILLYLLCKFLHQIGFFAACWRGFVYLCNKGYIGLQQWLNSRNNARKKVGMVPPKRFSTNEESIQVISQSSISHNRKVKIMQKKY